MMIRKLLFSGIWGQPCLYYTYQWWAARRASGAAL